MKVCVECNTAKEQCEFHKKSSNKDGLQRRCRTCRNKTSARWAADYRLRNKPNKEAMRRADLKKKYNLTPEQWDEMLTAQAYECAICRSSLKHETSNLNRNVDHCHLTGKVRGILCKFCNLGLGYFKDNTSLINNAIRYLEEHR